MQDQEIPPSLRERFRDFRLLGQGTYGKVWRATDRALGRDVALKLMVAHVEESPTARKRFLREAKLAARLRHPRVTEVYDYGFADEHPYIVFQFVEGSSLKEYLDDRGGRLSLEETGPLVLGVLEGLGAMHAEGVLHRDLKPANVLIDGEGRVFVADFGLARSQGEETITKTGQLVGSPGYMSPEQMEGERVDASADLYAVGMLFWELLTGEFAFGKDSFPAVYGRKLGGLHEPYSRQHPGGSPLLDAGFAALLAPDPRDRPGDAAAVRAWLEGALEGRVVELPVQEDLGARQVGHTSVAAARVSSSLDSPRSGPGRWTPWMLGGAAALVAAGLLVHALLPASPPPGDDPFTRDVPLPAEVPPPSQALRELRRELHGAPEIVPLLALEDGDPSPEVLRTWRSARQHYRRRVPALREAVAAARAEPPDPETFDELARLLLLQRLLASTRLPEEGPLLPPGEGTGLEEAYGRSLRVQYDPALSELPPDDPLAHDAGALAHLQTAGRRYRVLRSVPGILPEGADSARVRIRNPAGRGFVDPSHHLGEFARSFRNAMAPNFEESPLTAPLELEPMKGPLRLVLRVYDWDPTIHGWIRVEGERDAVHLLVTPSRKSETGFANQEVVRVTLHVEAAGDVLPEGWGRATFEVLGVQPLGDPSVTINLDAVYQQVAGPPPSVGEAG